MKREVTEVQIDPVARSALAQWAGGTRADAVTPGLVATSTRRLLEDPIAATLLRLAAPPWS
jgi:hypothetical protein